MKGCLRASQGKKKSLGAKASENFVNNHSLLNQVSPGAIICPSSDPSGLLFLLSVEWLGSHDKLSLLLLLEICITMK